MMLPTALMAQSGAMAERPSRHEVLRHVGGGEASKSWRCCSHPARLPFGVEV